MINQIYLVLCLLIAYFLCQVPMKAQESKEDLPSTKKIEVIGVKDSKEYEKTLSARKDPSGFTDVIKLEKAQTRYSSIDEVLEREVGLRVRRYGGLGSYSTLSIRGSNANQVRFFIDGVPINNTMGGEINLADLPFENLEEIEVYKSGTASGFSSSAIGGVVNLVTKKGKKTKSSQIKLAGGSFKTFQISALHKNFYNDLDYTFSILAEKSDQNFIFRNNNGTPVLNTFDDFDDVRRNAWFNRINFLTNLSYKINSTTFSFLNDFNYRMHGIPGPSFNQTQKIKRKFVKNTSAFGTSTESFLIDNINFQTRFFYTGALDELFDPKQEFSSSTPNARANIQQYGLHVTTEFFLLDYFQILRIFLATERETFRREEKDKFHETTEKIPRKFRTHEVLQIQDEFQFFQKRLRLLPSLQFEKYVDRHNEDPRKKPILNLLEKEALQKNFTNYRFGTIGIPYKNKGITFSWKFNASIETRFPDFLELFGERGSIIGNPNLKPEKSKNYDLGPVLDLQFKDFSFTTSIAFFNKQIQDMILFIPNSQFSLRPENVDSASIKGIEFTLRAKIYEKLNLDSNYTYQKAINTSNVTYLKGKYLALRPLHEWQGGISYLEKDKWELGFLITFVGAVFKDRSNEYQNYEPSRWLYNLYFTYFMNPGFVNDIVKEFKFTLEVKNIFDTRAYDIVGYPLPGRAYYATLVAKF